MKTLPKTIQSDGFTITRGMREDDIAIYRRTKQIGDRVIEHFEVIVVRVKPERQIFGKTIPEHEKYPSSEDWGRMASPARISMPPGGGSGRSAREREEKAGCS